MSDCKLQYFLYICGHKTPVLSTRIQSSYGSLSQIVVSVPYSPYLSNIYEFTKVQIYELKIDGNVNEPTLEGDGVIIGVTRSKSVLGNVSLQLTVLSDAVVYNIRKRFDFYLTDITNADTRMTGDVECMRADENIENFFADTLQNNRFDVGCATCSMLTSNVMGDKDNKSSYSYIYNGKKYYVNINKDVTDEVSLNPKYYNKYLYDYKLMHKFYGVSTSEETKEFFQHDRFLKLITNNCNDLRGENSFWSIAQSIMEYGFCNLYDIPNPTYIPATNNKKTEAIDLGKELEDAKSEDSKNVKKSGDARRDLVNVTASRAFDGLAEFIIKPRSIAGIPLKCNVIWPDQVISENLFKDYMSQPTRVIWQRHMLPGAPANNPVLTTSKLAGPIFDASSDNYFNSFTPNIFETTDENKGQVRDDSNYSDYEQEYGVKYHELSLSHAFDEAFLEKATSAESASRINNLLNYEFIQKFLSTRNIGINVTQDVNIVTGLPVIVLNKFGQHIIAFCTGKSKEWNAQGGMNVTIQLAYPRYYYEDIGVLGNIIDPTSQDQTSLAELELLFGSKALVKAKSTPEELKSAIDSLFQEYLHAIETNTIDNLYKQYSRTSCTMKEFFKFHDFDTTNCDLPESYPSKIFDIETNESGEAVDPISSHYFEVYNDSTKKIESCDNLSVGDIIKRHNEWVSKDHRI